MNGQGRVDQFRSNRVTISSETIATAGEGATAILKHSFDYYCPDEVSQGRTKRVQSVEDIPDHLGDGRFESANWASPPTARLPCWR